MGSPSEWQQRMSQSGEFGDQVFLQLAANMRNRQKVIIPVFKDQGHGNEYGVIVTNPEQPSQTKTSHHKQRPGPFMPCFIHAVVCKI